MADVSVVIPFTSDEPWRVRARDHVVDWYRRFGWETVEGTCPDPWRKAVAIADAVSRSAGDVLVVADADCVCDGVARAVAAVEGDGAAWAMPHLMVHRLDVVATEGVYAGVDPAVTVTRVQRPYRGWPGGGVVVLPRATWDRVPMDPRFVGWGQDDETWAMALTTLAGPCARLAADLYHLWHPPAPRQSRRWGSAANRALYGRYRAAAGLPVRMAALVAESAETLAGAPS